LVLDPVSGAVVDAWVPVAASVAVSFSPLLAGAYWTVTLHDMPGPRLRPVQVSAVVLNALAAGSVMVSAPEALPPVLVSLNVCVVVVPEAIGPAVHDDGVNVSNGGALLASAAGA
jgi:hypothetical protein